MIRAMSPGVATGVGSLPHTDPRAAVELSLTTTARLPAAPQLPARSPREGVLAQWLDALPEVDVAADGSIRSRGRSSSPAETTLRPDTHAGLLAFLDHLGGLPGAPAGAKAQITGPLTLGTALVDAGMDARVAYGRAAELAESWADTVVGSLRRHVNSEPVLFLDEPSLVLWNRDDEPPLPHEDAVDLLSGVLASVDAISGVHVCGGGDRRVAFEAGPDVVGFPAARDVLGDGVAVSRYLDGGGWIAWGAVPTEGPVGERADHWWNELVGLWCDLTRAGCDPALLRTQALITPACGLARHTETQAATILAHCVEIGERVREQAIATRLSVGA